MGSIQSLENGEITVIKSEKNSIVNPIIHETEVIGSNMLPDISLIGSSNIYSINTE